jgi:hypothetical protein
MGSSTFEAFCIVVFHEKLSIINIGFSYVTLSTAEAETLIHAFILN